MTTTDLPRCVTCRHWGYDSFLSKSHRSCDRIKAVDYPYIDAAAYVQDAVSAGLYTRPDFGCVLHEPREAKA